MHFAQNIEGNTKHDAPAEQFIEFLRKSNDPNVIRAIDHNLNCILSFLLLVLLDQNEDIILAGPIVEVYEMLAPRNCFCREDLESQIFDIYLVLYTHWCLHTLPTKVLLNDS